MIRVVAKTAISSAVELCPGLRTLDRVPGPVLRDSDWPGSGTRRVGGPGYPVGRRTRVPGYPRYLTVFTPPPACLYRSGSGKVLKRLGSKEVGGRKRLDFVSYCTMNLDK